MSRIRAVRAAFPPYRYPQHAFTKAIMAIADATGGLRPSQRALLERLHANAEVSTRHTVLPIEEYSSIGTSVTASVNSGGAGASANDRYIHEATALGERALRSALHQAGIGPGDLDLLIVTSVTGVAVPSLDARLIPRLGLRADIKRLPIFGLGCVAGAAGLARLHDYLLAWPGHSAALLAVELCSLTWPRGEVATADLVASALFGDGAAALVATGDGVSASAGAASRRRLPRVVATRSEVYPDSTDSLGWRLVADGFRIVLTAELAEVVERRLAGSVTAFLADHGLTTDDIKRWICHPGGPKVLDAAQRALKLPDDALATSRQSLSEAGNMSSVSVLHILELTADAGTPPEPGSYGLVIGLGPGVSAELLLMRW